MNNNNSFDNKIDEEIIHNSIGEDDNEDNDKEQFSINNNNNIDISNRNSKPFVLSNLNNLKTTFRYSNFSKSFHQSNERPTIITEHNDNEIQPQTQPQIHQMQLPQLVNNKYVPFEISFPLKYKSTLQGHSNKVIAIIFLSSTSPFPNHEHKLASGGYDNTIKIWKQKSSLSTTTSSSPSFTFSYEIEKTLQENNYILTLLEFEPNLLLVGTASNAINLWSLYTDQKIYSFIEHSLWVNSLIKVSPKYFISCSNDSKIILWNYSTKKKEGEMNEHTDCVLTVISVNNTNNNNMNCICSGSADNSIKMWNWTECKCVMTMIGHKKWVKCLCQLDNGDIASGSDDKTIKVWKKGICVRTIKAHDDAVRTLCVFEKKYLISGGFDCAVKVWDMDNEGKCVQIVKEHTGNVICVIKKEKQGIITCSNDNTIKIWKWNYEGGW